MKKTIHKLETELIGLEAERKARLSNSLGTIRITAKIDKIRNKLAILRDTERKKPVFRTEGIPVFHVLTKEDLESIWRTTGVKKALQRVNALPTAKYTVKRSDGIVIYLDVRPAGIFYVTHRV